MLALVEVEAGRGAARWYGCQVTALAPRGGRVYRLGSGVSGSARLALRWLRWRARDVAEQLHPAFAQPLLGWLRDEDERERALATLTAGRAYEVTVFDGDGVRYVLAAHCVRSPPGRPG